MKKSNSNQEVFPKYEYIVYCIVLISGRTYFLYYPENELWLNVLYSILLLFSGLTEALQYIINWGYELFDPEFISRVIIWGSLPVIPILVAGIRNFSPPYSTFIRFYFVSNIIGWILLTVLGWSELLWFAITISMLILHLNIILSKNPIVKGIDNLTIKLPSSSGSSSLGDDLD